ncbi:MAG: carbohydrate binding family 9 domain-containing protein [Gemmatimonadetes bacterium]|nr:carbohydrate binding family 9 domain-containing protein [Gemmatimonadota bacterium]
MLLALPALVALAAAAPLPPRPTPVVPPSRVGRATVTPRRPPEVAQVRAVRAAVPPRLDGRDDDAVWQGAERTSDFVQFDPKPAGQPVFRTDFRVAYDERNLYVFVRMYDPHPDSIRHALTRRDQRGPSDQIKLLIDSQHDRRSGYEFAVNPDGVKRDFAMSNDGNEDPSWDGVWDVATRVDSLGWTAEFRIPLSQLRYPGDEDHVFGFGVWRDIERFKEREAWPEYVPTKNGLVSQLGELHGLHQLASGRRFEAAPYTVTKNVERSALGGVAGREQQVTVGGDFKLGLAPSVTLDATVNPDFGQVEADPAVVNLTAYETFFGEKRPFFLEGTALYQFNLNCYIVVDCSTNEGLFYSRRIGRSPSLAGQNGDPGTAIATPITGAAKLTGRTSGGLAFGLLEAVTPRVAGTGALTAEPASNYAVLRATQDWNGGRTGIGLIGTAVNRQLDASSSPWLHESAYAVGGNVRQRFGDGSYEASAQVAASHVSGSASALLLTQRGAVHYFQRPTSVTPLDSSRTSLDGYEAQLKFGKYGGGITRFETSVVRISDGFDVNDLGYLRRADVTDWSTWGALTFREPTDWYRWAQLNGNHWIRYNSAGQRFEHAVNVNGHVGLKGIFDNWDAHLGGTFWGISNTVCDRCTRGGPALGQSAGYYPWAGFNTDSRKPIDGGLWVNLGITDEGRSRSARYNPYVDLRVGTRFVATLGAGYSVNVNDAQWIGNFTDSVAGRHYGFAHLDQTTVSLSARLNYTATPTLTFEFYGQPFVSNGVYGNVRELSATPEAADYQSRFRPFAAPAGTQLAFHYAQLTTNAVVRWEYVPGSTLFVVWQHGRVDTSPLASGRGWAGDMRELFDDHPQNTFLVKVSYWLSR